MQSQSIYRIALTAFFVCTTIIPDCIAQPQIVVSPPTLFFQNADTTANDIYVVNTGSDPLIVDSLSMSETNAYSWGLFVSSPDTSFTAGFAFGVSYEIFPDMSILPSDSLRLTFFSWDGCLICSNSRRNLSVVDTLFVYSSDLDLPVTQVLFDSAFYVGTTNQRFTDNDSIQIYPTPSHHSPNIQLITDRTENVLVSIVNLLGQTMRSSYYQIYSGSTLISTEVASLPSGVYLVTADIGGRLLTKSFVIL